MTYLFFDTETTGLPDFRMPPEWEGQPRICQIGAILTDRDGFVKSELNLIIRPAGWTIPSAASDIHGITQEAAEKYGVSMRAVLSLFNRLCTKAELVVAHNIKFDQMMIEREASAAEFPIGDFRFEGFCTMEAARNVVQCPPTEKMLAKGMTGFKSPSLTEAYRHFFGSDFEGAHDAMADVRACKDVFFKLREKLAEAA